MKKYNLAILVDNKPGVLTHVSGLISRRAFNIESISAGYTEEQDVTRINIEVSVQDQHELEQVVNQLSKLIDIIKIVNLGLVDSIIRELVLIKVRANKETLPDIRNIVEIFRGKIDAICDMLAQFEIIELARTGTLAMSRGPVPVKEME